MYMYIHVDECNVEDSPLVDCTRAFQHPCFQGNLLPDRTPPATQHTQNQRPLTSGSCSQSEDLRL